MMTEYTPPPRAVGPILRRGLVRLGALFFEDFGVLTTERSFARLYAGLDASEQRELKFLLIVAAFAPIALFRILFLCERETYRAGIWRTLAPIHIQVKGFCALVYFDALDTRHEDDHD